ncbi:odorant receptor 7a-like [Nilaparvata lugens]|uniref:odorant receptor 7a-like n=2 Tax=Nilaparvata lugens TaxID=108931 RepID=UPI00193DC1F2|nr:odorant receptor 7a-like [Nilaparvata lugens]
MSIVIRCSWKSSRDRVLYLVSDCRVQKFWQDEDWESIMRGLEKTKLKYVMASSLLIYPKNPWLTYNIIMKLFHLALLGACMILAIAAPLLIKMFGSEEKNRIKEINYDLPVPSWFPFNTESILGFTVAYTLILCEICVIVMYVGAAVPSLVYLVFEVNLQFMLLEKSILNLESRANEIYKGRIEHQSENNPLLYERCVKECLRENLLHHIAISRFFSLHEDITSTIYGILIGLSMIVLATISLVLTRTKVLSFEMLKFIFLFMLELTIVFGYCFMGTSLSDASSRISNALYNCTWYKLSEKQKKTLIIFQLCSKNEIVLKGSWLFQINLQLFVQIMQTTYSIFNIFATTDLIATDGT